MESKNVFELSKYEVTLSVSFTTLENRLLLVNVGEWEKVPDARKVAEGGNADDGVKDCDEIKFEVVLHCKVAEKTDVFAILSEFEK
jgi:hypothetical protein